MDQASSSKRAPIGAALPQHGSRTESIAPNASCSQSNVLPFDVPANEHQNKNLMSAARSAGPQNERGFCRANPKMHPCSQRPRIRPKTFWSKEEDEQLIGLVQKEVFSSPKDSKVRGWNRVAAQLKKRTRKQCRERYIHHLKPGISRHQWSSREETTLIEAHKKWGNKWVTIAAELPGRTENCVKNRWHSILRKQQLCKPDLKAVVDEGVCDEGHCSGHQPDITTLAKSQQFSTPSSTEVSERDQDVTFNSLCRLMKPFGSPSDLIVPSESECVTCPSPCVSIATTRDAIAQISPFVSPSIRFVVKILRAKLHKQPNILPSQIATVIKKGILQPVATKNAIEASQNDCASSGSIDHREHSTASVLIQNLKSSDVEDVSSIDNTIGQNNKDAKCNKGPNSICKVALRGQNPNFCFVEQSDVQIVEERAPTHCNHQNRHHSGSKRVVPSENQHFADTVDGADEKSEMVESSDLQDNISNPLLLLALAASIVSRPERVQG